MVRGRADDPIEGWNFRPDQAELFKQDAAAEDVDARFFDANGDKLPDLYVVSGGNEFTGGKDSALWTGCI